MADESIPRNHLALGEYVYFDADGKLPATVARSIFFDTIRVHAPEVLASLAGRPYRLYKRLRRRMGWYEIEPLMIDKGLRAWSHEYHLKDEWCLIRAVKTLDSWCVRSAVEPGYDPSADPERQWGPRQLGMIEVPQFAMEDISFSVHWHPLFETRAQILHSVNLQLDAIEEKARAIGCIKPKEVRQWDDFVWLVQFQIRGERYISIADRYSMRKKRGPSDAAVGDQVRRLAEELGLTLREAPRGWRTNAEKHRSLREMSI